MDAGSRNGDSGTSAEAPLDTAAEEQAWDEAMHQALSLAKAQGKSMAGCQHRADGRQPSPGEGRRCDRRTHPFIRLPQLIELLKVQPEFARRPKTRPERSAVLPITEQRTFRSSVIRLTGTSIRQHRSAALIPSTSRFSQSSLPE